MDISSATIKMQKGAEGFSYLAEPQRTKPWFDIKIGKPSASGLGRWMGVSKVDGKPLKARYDYEKELIYERTFGVSVDHFATGAMLEGIEYEYIIRDRYEQITGNMVDQAGAFYNNFFVASPDGLVGEDGGTEFKLLRDNSFMDVLTYGLPEDHYLQVQGCLLASGRQWWDYAAANLKTKKVKIIRVYPDVELHKKIKASTEAGILYTPKFSSDNIYDLQEVMQDTENNLLSENPWEAPNQQITISGKK